jgi:hypothetical protein
MIEKRKISHLRNHQQANVLLVYLNHRGNFLLSGMRSPIGTVNGSQNYRFVTGFFCVLDSLKLGILP